MKSALPVLLAGGSFACLAIAGLGAGILAQVRTGSPVWPPLGLLLGILVGAYSAYRLLAKSLS